MCLRVCTSRRGRQWERERKVVHIGFPISNKANSRCRWAIAERKRRRPQSARGSDVLFCAGAVYIQRAAMLHIKTRSVLINLTRHCLRPTSIGVLDDVVQLNANVQWRQTRIILFEKIIFFFLGRKRKQRVKKNDWKRGWCNKVVIWKKKRRDSIDDIPIEIHCGGCHGNLYTQRESSSCSHHQTLTRLMISDKSKESFFFKQEKWNWCGCFQSLCLYEKSKTKNASLPN